VGSDREAVRRVRIRGAVGLRGVVMQMVKS
jgi:hypothetical protein